MPYRNGDKEPFNPELHQKSANGSYARKTAIEHDRDAGVEALLRSQERNWFKKLFNYGKVGGVDVLHEEALREHVGELEIYGGVLKGKFNGVAINLTKYGVGEIDGKRLGESDTDLLFNLLAPLVTQHDQDKEEASERKNKRAERSPESAAAIAKLLGPRPKELSESEPPKQLPKHKPDDEGK